MWGGQLGRGSLLLFVQVHAKTGLCYLAEVDSLQAVPYAASSTPLA